MNWYQSKPNQTKPWQPAPPQGLMQAPGGPAPQGQSFGQNTGGYSYTPNQFANAGPIKPTAPPPMTGGGAMSFGSAPPGVGMAPPPSMQQGGPRDAMAQQMQNPQMQQQMMRIGAIRGGMV